jgi:hypothetical protein
LVIPKDSGPIRTISFNDLHWQSIKALSGDMTIIIDVGVFKTFKMVT